MQLVVLSAGAGEPSSSRLLADRLGAATQAALADQSCAASLVSVQVRTLGPALLDALTTRTVSPELAAAQEAVLGADGLIAVTPVYNGSYSGLFKLFFDALDPRSLAGRPVLLGATGGSPRHSLVMEHALLPLFYYFRAEVAPLAVYAASADWSQPGELDFRIEKAAAAFARRIISSHPAKELPAEAVLDYDDLLRG
ncbi:MAG: NAD(P)H-dependent oxidoreductase [Propionibacteriales bacterium]|nr:NAD(P)H-dependent oxidoreductase [Propionibacteriales bacterium]